MGLSIVKRLAELMGGEVGVRSEVGKGSTFWVRVAVEVPQAQPTRMTIGARPKDSDRRRYFGGRESLAMKLKLYGFDTVAAGSVDEALERSRPRTPRSIWCSPMS